MGEVDDDEGLAPPAPLAPLASLADPLADAFVARRVVIGPARSLDFLAAEWSDAIVVLQGGEIEVESETGVRCRFVEGDVLWLTGLGLRRLSNPAVRPAVLLAVRRRATPDRR